MSGRIGDLSPEQKIVLKEFREDLADVLNSNHDDPFLLRWLRARQFDKNKAEVMLRKSLLWRKQIGADSLLKNFQTPEVVEKYVPSGFLGFDKEGSTVRILPQGSLDYKGLVFSIRKADLIKSLAAMYEYDLQQMKMNNEKTGNLSETFVFILDYEGFSVKQVASKAVMDVIFELLKVFEANYPERLKTAFVINVPPLFSTLFTAVKPLLAEETRKKFQFFGKDGWKDILLEHIDHNILPVYLGGNKTDEDGDPRCPSIIIPGGTIPESYYLKNKPNRLLSGSPDVIQVTVDGKSVHTVDIHVPMSDSTIEWEIETDDTDIGIGLLFLNKVSVPENDQELYPAEEVLPTERLCCHLLPEKGTFYCERAGFYILQIDNSYSKFRQKVVRYKTRVISPKNSDEAPPTLNIHSLRI